MDNQPENYAMQLMIKRANDRAIYWLSRRLDHNLGKRATTWDNDQDKLAFAQMCDLCKHWTEAAVWSKCVICTSTTPYRLCALVANQTRSQQLHSSPQNVINWINQTNQSCDLGHVT